MFDFDDEAEPTRWCSCCGPDYNCKICGAGIMSYDDFSFNEDGIICAEGTCEN